MAVIGQEGGGGHTFTQQSLDRISGIEFEQEWETVTKLGLPKTNLWLFREDNKTNSVCRYLGTFIICKMQNADCLMTVSFWSQEEQY